MYIVARTYFDYVLKLITQNVLLQILRNSLLSLQKTHTIFAHRIRYIQKHLYCLMCEMIKNLQWFLMTLLSSRNQIILPLRQKSTSTFTNYYLLQGTSLPNMENFMELCKGAQICIRSNVFSQEFITRIICLFS